MANIIARLKYLGFYTKSRDIMNIGMYSNKLKLVAYLAMLVGVFYSVALPSVSAQGLPGGLVSSPLTSALCSVIGTIATVIGVIAIFMFVLGGILYSFAHFLPAAGNLKGSMQGWGMGMLMGGIVMLILYLLAPFIVGKIIAVSQGGVGVGIPAISRVFCP